MDDKEMEFRVGVFVAIATCVAAFMVFHFSELSESFRSSKMVSVHFRDAGGLHSSSPVRMSGIQIGSVREIRLDEVNGGVLVQLAVQEKYTIRQGSQPRITSSVLGDSAIDFTPGVGTEPIEANTIIPGVAASGPMESIANLEDRVGRALDVFTQTGREWGRVGASMNKAVSGTDGRQMNRVMNATLASLEEFTRTMRTASQTLQSAQGVLADSATQDGLRATLDALPKLVNDTRQAIQAVRVTVQRVDRNMQHLDTAIAPIAANSKPMASRLNNTLANLETLSGELAHFSKMLRTRDGSVQRLVSDPSLYRNMNATAASLAVFLKNAEPVISDLRIFSDKIARHPELIGVRGAFRGSSGIKQTDYQERKR